MLNPWNDLLKQENNQGVVAQSNPVNNMMYENDPNNMMLMNGTGVNTGGNNGMVSNNMTSNSVPSQAQVAAAVATAMMMQNQNGNCNSVGMSGIDDGMDDDDCGDDDDDGDSSMNNDAEGVWSPDIEQSFQEALAIYPPCGRRKIILSEEGKMYGRNELIARYIKVRTGKSRSRKQVSSHIQVLAKRKTKDFHSTFKDEKSGKCGTNPTVGFSNPFSHLTSAQIISPVPLPNGQQQNTNNGISQPQQQQHQPTQPQQSNHINNVQNQNQQNIQNPNQMHMQMMNQNIQNQQMINQQSQRPLANSHNTHNHHNQPQQQQHQPQMLQNCTNILPHVTNMNLQQSQSCNIWSHPGLQPEKKARIDMSQNIPASTMPCSASSPNQLNSQGDELIPSSSSSSASSSSSIGNHNMLGQTSPESSSPPNQNLWPASYTKNNEFNANKSIVGLHGLRLIEFSCFLEQRPDTEIYNKHLFVHLNTSDYLSYNSFKNDNNNNNGMNAISEPSDEFENINYMEFADKFPENDLLWSLASVSNDKAITSPNSSNSSVYLIKFWVDLNYTLEENVNAMYAVTNIFESLEPLSISCSTKVCSFGNQVVEKVETEHAQYESNGRCGYRFENSPMCEYMVTFINKLKKLPERNLKNSVLENFSVLQLIKNNDTQELLLTLAYVFEVSTSDHGAQHNIYKLTK